MESRPLVNPRERGKDASGQNHPPGTLSLSFRPTMKLKCQPEDFRVEELPLVSPAGHGRYAFYRLTKRGLGTLEAVNLICRRWNIAGRRISYGGLKDRHAADDPVPHGFRRAHSLDRKPGLLARASGKARSSLSYGRLPRQSVRPGDSRPFSRGSRARSDLARSLDADGLPNYFDDQRFGSVGVSGEFIGHAWLKGNAERALELAPAEANPSDRSAAKVGEIHSPRLLGQLARGKETARSVFGPKYRDLSRRSPDRFSRGLRADAARAAHLVLLSVSESSVELDPGSFDRALDPARTADHDPAQGGPASISISARARANERSSRLDDPASLVSKCRCPKVLERQVIEDVLAGFELTWSDLRVRHLKDVFFSKGSRSALVFPENLAASRHG